MTRLADVTRFYAILDALEHRLGSRRRLHECSARQHWPHRGVYLFFEPGEQRANSGDGARVVRVGTHALTKRSKTTLWQRLSQHRGIRRDGGGNHRGSIFRLLIGQALIAREGLDVPSWGVGADPGKAAQRLGITRERVKVLELPIEHAVTATIGAMGVLWLAVDDAPGPDSLRGYLERNAITLLSNYQKPAIDAPSGEWLGRFSDRERVRRSGLWNSNHVGETYDPAFLDLLERQVEDGTALG